MSGKVVKILPPMGITSTEVVEAIVQNTECVSVCQYALNVVFNQFSAFLKACISLPISFTPPSASVTPPICSPPHQNGLFCFCMEMFL